MLSTSWLRTRFTAMIVLIMLLAALPIMVSVDTPVGVEVTLDDQSIADDHAISLRVLREPHQDVWMHRITAHPPPDSEENVDLDNVTSIPAPDPEAPGHATASTTSPTDARIGWGGYITQFDAVIPMLEDLQSGGYSAIRYWARPAWFYGRSRHNLDFAILDHLVTEAARRGITVYIDCEHNYPPAAFITRANRDIWITDVLTVGLRYQHAPNVVLEPINEYTGSDQVALYNWGMHRIRDAGIHLPLLWNFWWNQPNVALEDPDQNYAIGRHLYGSASLEAYHPSAPVTLEEAVTASGAARSMYRYFDDPRETYYLQSVLALAIPNGWVITELGPTDNEGVVAHPSVGSLAYAMQFLREAVAHNVTVICYRIGTDAKKTVYEHLAHEYFAEDYMVSPQLEREDPQAT